MSEIHNGEGGNQDEKGKPLPSEVALTLAQHIQVPCIDQTTGRNIRNFYIREAERLMPELKKKTLPLPHFYRE